MLAFNTEQHKISRPEQKKSFSLNPTCYCRCPLHICDLQWPSTGAFVHSLKNLYISRDITLYWNGAHNHTDHNFNFKHYLSWHNSHKWISCTLNGYIISTLNTIIFDAEHLDQIYFHSMLRNALSQLCK